MTGTDSETVMERVAGIDLAWALHKPSGVCIADLDRSNLCLRITSCRGGLMFQQVLDALDQTAPHGVAIDAPLIIPNQTGNRACERAVTSAYGSRHAGCHTSNRNKYPDAVSCRLADLLVDRGHIHAGNPAAGRWQIECYPHPAIIEIFGLPKRLKYKKGSVEEQKAGQITLANLIRKLAASDILILTLNEEARLACEPQRIRQLRGQAIKNNEDLLDGLLCAYIAGLYTIGASCRTFGNVDVGYIVVPTVSCVSVGDMDAPTVDTTEVTQSPGAQMKAPPPRRVSESPARDGSQFVNGGGKYNRVGAINRNDQKCLGTRGTAGTDHGQVVFGKHCRQCERDYGVNGTSVFQCRCPHCQGGKSNLEW